VGIFAKKSESGGEIVRKDLEHIKCGVCQRVAHELASSIEALRSKAVAGKIGEFQIVEILDTVCKPTNLTTGLWTRQLDIVENTVDGKVYLDLTEPGGRRRCNNECLTIAKSCDSLLEAEIDSDDFSAFLYRNKVTGDELQTKLCTKLTKRCVGPPKPLPEEYKRQDEEFIALEEKETKVEELLATMREAGLRGDMKRREEMTEMLDEYAEPYNPYEDEYENEVSALHANHHHAKKPFAPPGYAKNSHESDDEEL